MEVNELSRYRDIEERKKFDDYSFKAFGIDWILEVSIGSQEEKEETGTWFHIFLHKVTKTQ